MTAEAKSEILNDIGCLQSWIDVQICALRNKLTEINRGLETRLDNALRDQKQQQAADKAEREAIHKKDSAKLQEHFAALRKVMEQQGANLGNACSLGVGALSTQITQAHGDLKGTIQSAQNSHSREIARMQREHNSELRELKRVLENLRTTINTGRLTQIPLADEIASKTALLREGQKMAAQYQEQTKWLDNRFQQTVNVLREENAAKDRIIEGLQNQVSALRGDNQQLTTENTQKTAEILDLQEQVFEKLSEIEDLKSRLESRRQASVFQAEASLAENN